jgi:1,4-alpha-glucan branching enzyme
MQVGSFTPEGTFSSAMAKLPYLAALGITLVELMPVMHYCGPADSWGCVSCSCVPNATRPRCGRGLP